MSVSGINFAGLSSGIDTNSIIQQLLTIERRPEQTFKIQQGYVQQRQAAYSAVSAQLIGLQSAAFSLNGLHSFDLVAATSNDTTVATVSAQTGAQTGSHTIVVNHLATAQRLGSAAQPSQTAPLNYNGQIVINGKAINVKASDSLTTLAGNINAAQAGVNASIISPSPNQYYLTLNSNNSGAQGQIALSDTGNGSFLGTTLGLFGAGTSLRHTISASVVGSDLFQDSATSVATLQGQTSAAAGNVQITSGGVTKTVAVDLHKSLSGIATDINTAFGSSVATVATVNDPITGASRQQLQLSGVTSAAGLVDDQNVLANLGLVQKTYAASAQLTAGANADFTLDGLTASRPTNSFSDAISGVTINLLKDGGAKTTLNVNTDTDTIKANINAYVKAFNATTDTISNLSQFDSSSGKTGPLFGDVVTQTILDSLVSNATNQVSGLPSNLSLLSQVGITLDQSNHLVVNDAALSNALTNNLQGVGQLFRANGTSSDPTVQFVSGTADTKTSGSTGYTVAVTQAATQATILVGTAQTAPLAQDEVLTFGGSLFGTDSSKLPQGGYGITLKAGSALSDIISQINGDSKLSPLLAASNVGGKLTLTAKNYGSGTEFGVISGVADTGNGASTGIGTTAISKKGLDVAGTINGEAATGSGQFLTGSQIGPSGLPNGQAYGLQLRLTATSAGNYGTVTFTSGIAAITNNYVTNQTDAFKGALTTATNNLQTSYTDLQSNIQDIEDRAKAEETRLREQFTNMELALARIKSANAGLAQLGVVSTSTSGIAIR